jgi:ferrous iron transport protein A
MTLDELDKGRAARVLAIDWRAIPDGEGRRLRLLGLDEGSEVRILHRGILFWRDPIAVRVGRMTLALRQAHARAVRCEYRERQAAADERREPEPALDA